MLNVAYNRDCLEAMREFPDNAFDLAIVDPPYGIERFKSGGSVVNKYGDETRQWNNEKPSAEYFTELMRVSRFQVIWGGNNFSLPTTEYFIIWQKGNAFDFSFAMCEYAWTNIKRPAKLFQLFHTAIHDSRIHPTQKPVALYKWLLTNYAKPGQKILDTHLGSGSSRIAAYDLGFEFVGYELDSDYFNAQEARFANHIAQPNFFQPQAEVKQEAMFA
jgi:site-specific DNA-methyltransferase (adenine-specific)